MASLARCRGGSSIHCFANDRLRLSAAVCIGEYVGLEEIDDGIWNVYFGPLEVSNSLAVDQGTHDYGAVHCDPADARQVDVLVVFLYPEPEPQYG